MDVGHFHPTKFEYLINSFNTNIKKKFYFYLLLLSMLITSHIQVFIFFTKAIVFKSAL